MRSTRIDKPLATVSEYSGSLRVMFVTQAVDIDGAEVRDAPLLPSSRRWMALAPTPQITTECTTEHKLRAPATIAWVYS